MNYWLCVIRDSDPTENSCQSIDTIALNLDPQQVLLELRNVSEVDGNSTVYVAYSGGADSTVLLHLLSRLRDTINLQLVALHANHGVDLHADEWSIHCANYCESLGIEFRSTRLDLGKFRKRMSESDARAGRYAWFKQQLGENELLLTAHHQDDQAETFLLNLMRGAGARGLGAIQPYTRFASGWLLRPLLAHSRQQITQYASIHNLTYIDDPSNLDVDYDRNYLRHVVLSSLSERWPAAVQQIHKATEQLTHSRHLLDALAKLDIEACRTEGTGFLSIGSQLNVRQLPKLDRPRQVNLLRYWARQNLQSEPGRNALDEFINTALILDKDFAELTWSNQCIYRYQNVLYLARRQKDTCRLDPVEWDLNEPLILEQAGLKLVPRLVKKSGLSAEKLAGGVTVRFRTGAERIRLPDRAHSSSLKKLFQQHLIPPWERNQLPLIYCQDELAAVVPWLISGRFKAVDNEPGISISIDRI